MISLNSILKGALIYGLVSVPVRNLDFSVLSRADWLCRILVIEKSIPPVPTTAHPCKLYQRINNRNIRHHREIEILNSPSL